MMFLFLGKDDYRADRVDGPQEMERNYATSKHVAWPSCAWLLLIFFPYPVAHPEHEHCTYTSLNVLRMEGRKSMEDRRMEPEPCFSTW